MATIVSASRRVVCAVALLGLGACAGAGQHAAFVPHVRSAPLKETAGTLIVRVTLKSPRFRPDYVSTASKGIAVRVVGLESFNETAKLGVDAAGCKSKLMTRFCELKIGNLKSCPSKKNCYSATVLVYDDYDAKKKAIPKSAKLLSAARDVGFNISNGPETLPIVLEGLPASVAFVPSSNASLYGNGREFLLPKCAAKAQNVSVFGVDADGNLIVGPGAPKVRLSSDDRAQLSVSAASATSNQYRLVPPSSPQYAHGNHTIHLTAAVTPGAESGGSVRRATIAVTYTGDICGVFKDFPIPTASAGPLGITVGPDGALWFTEALANKIGRITTGGAITEFSVTSPGSFPRRIAAGPGGLWFTENNTQNVARITTTGSVTEFYAYTGSTAGPLTGGIVAGPDGNLWFTKFSAISRMTVGGTVTDYPVATSSAPEIIVVGPDKNLWFNEFNPPRQIGTITTAGVLSEYPIPAGLAPVAIASGPDGALWFTDYSANVSRITTAGAFTSFYPVDSGGSVERDIISGPDGALWFPDISSHALGRITTTGAFSNVPMPLGFVVPDGLVTGPDGAIWFVEQFSDQSGKVGRLY